MKYEVQHYTLCGGWVNTWTICEDGIEKSHVFNSEAEASAELDGFFQDIEEEIQYGERDADNGYDREGFRIVCCRDALM